MKINIFEKIFHSKKIDLGNLEFPILEALVSGQTTVCWSAHLLINSLISIISADSSYLTSSDTLELATVFDHDVWVIRYDDKNVWCKLMWSSLAYWLICLHNVVFHFFLKTSNWNTPNARKFLTFLFRS